MFRTTKKNLGQKNYSGTGSPPLDKAVLAQCGGGWGAIQCSQLTAPCGDLLASVKRSWTVRVNNSGWRVTDGGRGGKRETDGSLNVRGAIL